MVIKYCQHIAHNQPNSVCATSPSLVGVGPSTINQQLCWEWPSRGNALSQNGTFAYASSWRKQSVPVFRQEDSFPCHKPHLSCPWHTLSCSTFAIKAAKGPGMNITKVILGANIYAQVWLCGIDFNLELLDNARETIRSIKWDPSCWHAGTCPYYGFALVWTPVYFCSFWVQTSGHPWHQRLTPIGHLSFSE